MTTTTLARSSYDQPTLVLPIVGPLRTDADGQTKRRSPQNKGSENPQGSTQRSSHRNVIAVVLMAAAGFAIWWATASWAADARTVLVVFAVAVTAWMVSTIDDTVVALAACCALVMLGPLSTDSFFASLGDATIWLLIGACLMAAGVTSSGLAERLAVGIMAGSTSVRGLFHRTTVALALTAMAIPATSGRAALTVPVLRSVATDLPPRLQRALSLLFPTVILLSAFGSLLGAGAHLIAAGLIEQLTGQQISFWYWMLLAAPVAVISSHLAAEVIYAAYLTRDERALPMGVVASELRRAHQARCGERFRPAERRALITLVVVIAAWTSSSLHGLHPAMVAVIGGVITVMPVTGTATPKKALAAVPWSMLTFLATTLALGGALVSSGAAAQLARVAAIAVGQVSTPVVLLAITAVSALAHLVVQSRSARATVLLAPLMALGIAHGLNPVAVALISTAAAGNCLTLTASAKPVAMFADLDGITGYQPKHLLGLSAAITPMVIGLVMFAALTWWPLLGISL